MSWWHKAWTLSMALLSFFFFMNHMSAMATIWGGFFVLGSGEWINRPSAEAPRKAHWLGLLLEAAGTTLMLYGAYLGFSSP